MPRRRSPDGAPAAAQRRGGTTLTPTSGNPPSGGEEGPEPKTPNPAGAAQQTPYTPAPATVALSQEAVCCDHRQNPPSLRGTVPSPFDRLAQGANAEARMPANRMSFGPITSARCAFG